MSAPKKLTTVTEKLRLGDVRLLDLNARYMRHETFQRLKANIAVDGCLTQAPFAVYDQGPKKPPLVISGNHRVKAGLEALGPDHEDWFITTTDKLPKARQIALQLSHNAVTGEDDPATLALLYEQIDSIDWQQFTGLDDAQLGLLEAVNPDPLAEAPLELQQVSLSFMPGELDQVKAAVDQADALAAGEHWVTHLDQYDAFLDALDLAARAYDVRNVAVAFRIVLDIFASHADDLTDGFVTPAGDPAHSGWVPLWAILGTDSVPAEVGAVISKAVKKMLSSGDITADGKFWALELWAADYLAGP